LHDDLHLRRQGLLRDDSGLLRLHDEDDEGRVLLLHDDERHARLLQLLIPCSTSLSVDARRVPTRDGRFYFSPMAWKFASAAIVFLGPFGPQVRYPFGATMYAPYSTLPDYRLDLINLQSGAVVSTGFFTAKQEELIGDMIRSLNPALMTFKLYQILHDFEDKTDFGTWLAENTELPIDPGL
jgi:hypothetical protein